jgi:hypothetical protein
MPKMKRLKELKLLVSNDTETGGCGGSPALRHGNVPVLLSAGPSI